MIGFQKEGREVFDCLFWSGFMWVVQSYATRSVTNPINTIQLVALIDYIDSALKGVLLLTVAIGAQPGYINSA